MIIDVFFYPDGKVVQEVVDRQEHACETVYKISERMGTMLSDEELPDCQPQTEIVNS